MMIFKDVIKKLLILSVLFLASCCGDEKIYFLSSSGNMDGLSVSGFAEPESFGRWSVANKATLDFSEDLPREFILTLDIGRAYGPNKGKTFSLEIAGRKITFDGPYDESTDASKRYQFKLTEIPSGTRRVLITVPSPTSPKELGKGDDDRKLGFALDRVFISPVRHSFACELLGFNVM